MLEAGFRRQKPTLLFQHIAQQAVGDGFTVDQYTVTIKQNSVKFMMHIHYIFNSTLDNKYVGYEEIYGHINRHFLDAFYKLSPST